MEVNWIVSKLEAFVIFAAVKKMFNHLSHALYFMLELSYFLISNDAYVSKWFNLTQVEIRYSHFNGSESDLKFLPMINTEFEETFLKEKK